MLGDRLWMAEGKCLLATAYTLMFAGFGRGLARWGAERAGRIMRLTTLIVLPVNFALVGELPALGRSSVLSLAVLVIDSAAMMALAWTVCRSMRISGGNATPAALIALGMANAASRLARRPSRWGFSAMLRRPCGVLMVACEWLGDWLSRDVTPPTSPPRRTPPLLRLRPAGFLHGLRGREDRGIRARACPRRSMHCL